MVTAVFTDSIAGRVSCGAWVIPALRGLAMHRQLLTVLSLATAFMAPLPGVAQTLSARPAVFADPVLATDPTHGELELGRTTLAAARRIFAVELADSVRLSLGRENNPDTLWMASEGGDSSSWPRPHHRLDLGADRYILYFDKHERLVMVEAERSRLPRQLRREDLVARYPTLRVSRHWNIQDELIAPLAPCISMTATVWEGDDSLPDEGHLKPGTVVAFGYRYTCQTRPAPAAIRPRE
jgi:hypothetical protein